MTAPGREFDITVLGATGWTATICAEHITKTLPTNLKWSIAGRSDSKLKILLENLKTISPDRLPPTIYTVSELNSEHLTPLIQKSKVVINGIGPYHKHATPVVEACARNGTDYVDFSTETLWIAEMIKKYDNIARQSGAVIIPAISGSSSPSDLVAWLIASHIRDTNVLGGRTVDEVLCSGKLTMLGMQGGSFITVLSVAEVYGVSWFWSGDSWVLSNKGNSHTLAGGWLNKLFGYRYDDNLGHLATSFIAKTNESVVHRSAVSKPDLYGSDFVFREYIPASSLINAVTIHCFTKVGILLLGLSWFRALMRRVSYEPGDGPDREESRKAERMDFDAAGFVRGQKQPVARARFSYTGALVDISAILAVESAATLLQREDGKLGERRIGGLLTPSTLGLPFVERLRHVGVDIQVE